MPVLLDTFTSTETAELRSSNCVNIALINNMPDTALEATERQFVDLLRASSSRVIFAWSCSRFPKCPAVKRCGKK
jgi:hypothetical protein